MDFEWDENKAKANIEKHGISFDEAKTVMLDPKAISFEYGSYEGETRYRTLGMSHTLNVAVVVWTFRGENIRIISAWKADKKRRKEYERQRIR